MRKTAGVAKSAVFFWFYVFPIGTNALLSPEEETYSMKRINILPPLGKECLLDRRGSFIMNLPF